MQSAQSCLYCKVFRTIETENTQMTLLGLHACYGIWKYCMADSLLIANVPIKLVRFSIWFSIKYISAAHYVNILNKQDLHLHDGFGHLNQRHVLSLCLATPKNQVVVLHHVFQVEIVKSEPWLFVTPSLALSFHGCQHHVRHEH